MHNLAKPVRIVTPYTEFNAERVGEMRVTLGNLNASDLTGPIRFTSSRSWDVSLANFTNSVEVSLNGGDINLRPGVLPLAKIDVRNRVGHIELALPQDAKFNLTATNRLGAVENEFGGPLKLEPTGRRGAILRGSNGGPSVDILTDNGQIVVRAASASDAITTPKIVPPAARPAPKATAPQRPPQPVEQ
jgi:hypothetical protein